METKNPAPRCPQAAAHWIRRAPVKGSHKASFVLCETKRGPRIPSKRRSHAHATWSTPEIANLIRPDVPVGKKEKRQRATHAPSSWGASPPMEGNQLLRPRRRFPPMPPFLADPKLPPGGRKERPPTHLRVHRNGEV